MITQFKIYEKLNVNEPEVGDYVIVQSNDFLVDINEFTKNRIGKLYNIFKPLYADDLSYTIIYDDIPKELDFYKFKIDDEEAISMNKEDIRYWSKYKEDLEKILMTNKFNL